jgi:hypothetical protein
MHSYSSNSDIFAIFAGLGFLMLVLLAFYIAGIVTCYIAVTHSVKKRIVNGDDFSTGDLFLWSLGWGFASAYTVGIATIIYFLVKRQDIIATKQRTSQILAATRAQAYAQSYQAGQYAPSAPSAPPTPTAAYSCPKCGAVVNRDMSNCPQCGVPLSWEA